LEVDGARRLLTVDHLFQNGNLHVEVSVNGLGTFRGQRLQPDTPVMPSSTYLDWALIELDTLASAGGTMLGQNWIVPPDSTSPVRIREVAPHPPRQNTRVLFVSVNHGVQEGVLLGGISYITSGRGRAVCPTLSLVLTSPNGETHGSYTLFFFLKWSLIAHNSYTGGILDGDCGSIIVDQRTMDVYGHLVGVDEALNIGYVVPMSETIQQIKEVFKGAETVSLPSSDPQPQPPPPFLRMRSMLLLLTLLACTYTSYGILFQYRDLWAWLFIPSFIVDLDWNEPITFLLAAIAVEGMLASLDAALDVVVGITPTREINGVESHVDFEPGPLSRRSRLIVLHYISAVKPITRLWSKFVRYSMFVAPSLLCRCSKGMEPYTNCTIESYSLEFSSSLV